MGKRFQFWYWLAVLGLLAACASTTGGGDPLAGSAWQLESIDGTAIPAEVNITIAFADGQVNGNGGCNSYGGNYQVQSSAITFDQVMMTAMACMGPEGYIEVTYMQAFGQIKNFTISTGSDGRDQLELQDDSMVTRLLFTRATP